MRDDTAPATAARQGGIFYGWWIVLANAAISLYVAGTFWYGAGVFINPLKQSLGWSTTEIAFAFSIRSAESGPIAPAVGYFIDRFGPRFVTLFGVALTGLGFILLSRVDTLATFYGGYMLMAIGTSACTGLVSVTNISNWFIKRRGRALGLFTAGAGLSGLIVPLLALLVETHGWRTALMLAGVGMWAVGTPMALVLRHRPEKHGMLPDGERMPDTGRAARLSLDRVEGTSTGQALRGRCFWLLSFAFLLSMTSLNAITIFLIPYLTDPVSEQGLEMGGGIAAGAITILTLTSLAGRFGFAALGDYYEKRYILLGLFVFQAAGLFILSRLSEPWHLIPFFLLFGPSYGGVVALRPAILADYFGRRCLGTIQGVAMGVMTIGGMTAPVMIGTVRDVTGGYPWAFSAVAVAVLLAVPTLVMAGRPSGEDAPGRA